MKIYKILIIFTILACMLNPVEAKQTLCNDNQIEYLNLVWWEKFGDENLNSYMTFAFENNQDLKVAVLSAKQAQQVVKTAFSNQLSQLSFTPQISREFTSSDTRFGDVLIPDYTQSRFLLPISMTYEADIWGENYLRTKSAKQKAAMIEQDERASYITITSALASDYYNLIKADKLLENQKELVKLQTDISNLYEKKYNGGLCSITDVLTQKQLLEIYTEELNNLKEKQDVLENQLKVILGSRYLGNIQRSDFNSIKKAGLPENINTEIIQNRPDVKKAEAYIKKIGIDVRVARREFLPKFLVFGQVGFNAYNLSKIFSSDTFLSNAGLMPSLDLFTGGRKTAILKYQKLEYEKALQIYEKTLLTAVQEVNDSMVGAKTAKDNLQSSEKRFELEKEKYELGKKKFEIGAASNLELLEYKKSLILSEKANISNEINTVISAIDIYKAVGGVDYTNL